MPPPSPCGQTSIILSDRRHNLHFQACSVFVTPMGPHHSSQHSGSEQVHASPMGRTTTSGDNALTLTDELVLLIQLVYQNVQTLTQNRHSLKDKSDFESELFTQDYYMYDYENGRCTWHGITTYSICDTF